MANTVFYYDFQKEVRTNSVLTVQRDSPKVYYQANPSWEINFIETDGAGSTQTIDVSGATAWASAVDDDFKYSLITGALTAGFSGAVTSITADGFATTPPSAGVIKLTNGASETEDVAYSSYNESGGVYTFVVDVTLTYTYLDNDVCQAEDTAPAIRTLNANIDSTSASTGKIIVTMDANTSTFADKVDVNQFLSGYFELRGVDGSGTLLFYAQFPATMGNTIDPSGSVAPAPVSNYYTKTEVSALLGGQDEFTELTDTPSSYSGESLKVVRVNAGETALEFSSSTDSDEKVKCSSNDTTAGYLEDKVVASEGSNTTNILEITTLNDGADEDVQLQIDQSKIDHTAIENVGSNAHSVIDTHLGSTSNPHSTAVTNLNDVTLTSEAQGNVLYRNATEWVNLAVGTSGQFLQTQGAGANPQWANGSVSALNDIGDVTITTGAQGDVFYNNGSAWVNLSPGTNGQVLTSGGAGANVSWTTPAGSGDMLASTYDPGSVNEQLVGLTATQTLTNKTLTTPIISSISNTGTVTLPTATDTLVARDTTDTLTNKTIDADNNTCRIFTEAHATSHTLSASECYGAVYYVTGASTITLPAVADGMHLTVVTIGAVAVSVDPNVSDKIWLDGTALDDGDKITNLSTAGDIAVLTYYSADGWYASTNSWTDGGV